jgi:signal transduction histidine kinase
MFRFSVLILGSIGIAGAALADGAPPLRLFDAAERVLHEGRGMPGAAAAWERVALPDELRRTAPGKPGRAWYRIRFGLDEAPRTTLALSLAHLRAHSIEFYVNGVRLGDVADWQSRRIGPFGLPVRVTIPAALLRAGENELAFRLSGASAPTLMHGLGRVRFGDAAAVREAERPALEAGAQSYRYAMAAMLAAGLIALFLWIQRRDDKVMFWFSAACLSWSLANALRLAYGDAGHPLFIWMNFNVVRYGLVVPTVVMCLRVAGQRWPVFETTMWGLFAFAVAFPALGLNEAMPWLYFGIPLVAAGLLATGAAAIVLRGPRPLRWSHRLEVAAVIAMALLLCHEFARYFGWIDVEAPVLRHFHVPVMLFAIGAAILERHVAAIWRIEQSNVELERRVAEKTREVESNAARLEASRREQALVSERQRILADMHDGVGASLIGLLRHVQSGAAQPSTIERRVQEALQEMRIAVDALQPREGDLASVLGSLRYRLDDMIQSTGVELRWEVAELPEQQGLTPAVVFAVQRILLEAISNALRHADARRLRFIARAVGEEIEICVEDDGKGFEARSPSAGQGIGNMRSRATRIGARLEIESALGRGTRVRLLLPRHLAGSA